ncbi:hypothetical protein QBC40DRAFT_302050 [Triangularia verruculosa]|uniref:Uncharacterized protein n=1 Tax=Triangularia verruculosa TaxID=2587418 RepID=A0AAN7AR16_9PEZI|nr:hypothetical protein QBC40DRAFT_302050 [Triangularia verruculosa]
MSLPFGLASSRWASAPASSRWATQSPSSAAADPVSRPCPGDNQIPAARCPSSPRGTRPSILDGTKPIVKMENPFPEGASGLSASRWASSAPEVCSNLSNLTIAAEPTYRIENPLKTGALGYRASRWAPPQTATTTFASTSSENKNKAGSERAMPPTGEQSHSFFETPLPFASTVRNSIPHAQPPASQMLNPLSIGHTESTQMRNPLMGSGLNTSIWAQRT